MRHSNPNQDPDALWVAYLDGQMSAAEATAFDSSLSPADRERLAAELRLEAGIAERLAQGPGCPEALWRRLQLDVRNRRPRRRRWPLAAAATLAAGIAVAAAISLGGLTGGQPAQADPPVLAINDATLEAFAAHALTPATRADTERYLLDHGIHLALADYRDANPQSRHEVRLLGACKGNCKFGSLFEVLYSCCGQPVKIAVARKDSGGARMIAKARKCGEVQAIEEIGEYVVAVIGKHPAPDLVKVLQPRGSALAYARPDSASMSRISTSTS
jgi:hypothetical protein